jgi:hypothetical protein
MALLKWVQYSQSSVLLEDAAVFPVLPTFSDSVMHHRTTSGAIQKLVR